MTLLPQSRQSARLFLQSSNWGLSSPAPSPAGECVPPDFGGGGGGVLTCLQERGGSQFRRGDRHCGTLCTVYVYFLVFTPFSTPPPFVLASNFDFAEVYLNGDTGVLMTNLGLIRSSMSALFGMRFLRSSRQMFLGSCCTQSPYL